MSLLSSPGLIAPTRSSRGRWRRGRRVLRVLRAALMVVVGALPISGLVALRLLTPVLIFFAFQALSELTIPGSLAVVVDGVEGALAPVASLPIHGDQNPGVLAGGR
jgi:hypothetical protein